MSHTSRVKPAGVVAAAIAASLLLASATAGVSKPKVGRPCQLSKRYVGFVCRGLFSGARPTLFKVVRPGLAPTGCAGQAPTRQSIPPGSTSNSIDVDPVWVRPDVQVDEGTNVWRTDVNLRHVGGWPVKWLWQAAPGTAPLQVGITDLTRGGRLIVAVHGTDRRRVTTLDSHNVLVEPANSWSSYVLFPGAGCYRLDVAWAGGTRTLTFGFGR